MLRLVTAFQSRFIKEEEGASMVEYGLLVALIAVVAIIAVTAVGSAVSENFDSVANAL
jgi:pilus assembly protein Flp/PilA